MSRKKKPDKGSKNKQVTSSSIHFELEENAEDLLRDHLKQFKPEKTETDEPRSKGSKVGKSRRELPLHEIDLHGLTLEQAQQAIRVELNELLEWPGLHRLRIITGKGHHSEGGDSILAKEIHGFVGQVYGRSIIEMEASPHEIRLNGVPLRGHFNLTLLGKSRSRDNKR